MPREKIGGRERMGSSYENVIFRPRKGRDKGKNVSFKAKKYTPKYKFPVDPMKGERKTITTKKGRRVTFEATGYSGMKFGQPKWKIISNKRA